MNLPNLSAAKIISYDLETKDPFLKESGPGWARGVGHVLGVAIAVDGWADYIPVGEHPDPKVVAWLKDTLETSTAKVGTNLQYDYGWLAEIGIWPGGPQYDIQFAEALLDDNMLTSRGGKRSISLDALAKHYLGKEKQKTEIDAHNTEHWKWSKDARENLWRMPPEIVGPYAIEDAKLPLEILGCQWPDLKRQNLWELFEMECKLIPIMVHIRRQGMPVNETAAMDARDQLLTIEHIAKLQLQKKAGFKLNVNSSKDLAVLFDKQKIPYGRTAKGNPSFTADFLHSCEAPIAQEVVNLRKTMKARSTFVEGAILDKAINGKIYPSLHPLRGDEYGTVSGRFSSSNPNSQQFSKRDDSSASIIRSIFVPSDGYPLLAAMDLSQIEYRLFAHYSGDDQLIQAYQDPTCDFHQAVADLVGGDFSRTAYKTINFSMLYGAGKNKLTDQLSSLFPQEKQTKAKTKALEFYNTYKERFPSALKLLRERAQEVSRPPYEIRTILGRKSRFVRWEEVHGEGKSYPMETAISKWGSNIQISGAYKALNRLLQGSAADLMKKGLVDAWEAGLLDRMGYPHALIHDEFLFSYHPDLQKEFAEFKECIENAIPLKVPVLLGMETGSNWWACK